MDFKRLFQMISLGIAVNACQYMKQETGNMSVALLNQDTKELLPLTDDEKFDKNFQSLYDNVDGAWFSFGDSERIRDALKELKSVPKFREIVSALPPEIIVGSSHFLAGNLSGAYNPKNKDVNVSSSVIGFDLLDSKKEGHTISEILFHELFHAHQDYKRLILNDNPSMFEVVVSQRLIEAEAYAWTDILQEIRKNSSSGTYCLSNKDIQDFMNKDIILVEKQKLAKERINKVSSHYLNYFKENNPSYCFQQSLKESKGDLDKACHLMAVKRMRYYLSGKDIDWTQSYYKQGSRFIIGLSQKYKISKEGNEPAFKKLLSYYNKKYGLSEDEMVCIPSSFLIVPKLMEFSKNLDKYKGWSEDHKKVFKPIANKDR
ncbi:MAG: hypothetical protein IKV03_06625 [Alphaproteobacteria bacterium]|nr:hypothetical protein [Alphaproteobacteria bacterium]